VKQLQALLDAAYAPVYRDSQSADIRRHRRHAIKLAAEHGIVLEHNHRYTLRVLAPSGINDPWQGNANCPDWTNALQRIKHYAGIKE
jgi:hypothetical protein